MMYRAVDDERFSAGAPPEVCGRHRTAHGYLNIIYFGRGTSARWPHQRVRTTDSSVALGGWRVAHATYPSLPLTSAAKAEGVWHLVARYLDIHAGDSRIPSPSKN